jgi:O-antigen/teichoic acid export membrane protein
MSFLKNNSIVILGVVISNLLSYFFHLTAGRILGPKDYGELGALMALIFIFTIPSTAIGFGISRFTSKFFTENAIWKIGLLRRVSQKHVLVLSVTLILLTIVFEEKIRVLLNIDAKYSIIIVGICILPALLLSVNRGILQGIYKYYFFSWNCIYEASARILLLGFFLYIGYGVIGAVLSYGFAYLIAYFLIFPYLKEINYDASKAEELNIWSIYKFIFLVLGVNVLVESMLNVPSLFIKHYYSSEFTGYWTAALNIAKISLFLSSSISLVMVPELSGITDFKKRKSIFKKSASLVLLISIICAFLFFLIPKIFILLLYGQAFLGAVPILQWMGFAMIFIGLSQVWANYLLVNSID